MKKKSDTTSWYCDRRPTCPFRSSVLFFLVWMKHCLRMADASLLESSSPNLENSSEQVTSCRYPRAWRSYTVIEMMSTTFFLLQPSDGDELRAGTVRASIAVLTLMFPIINKRNTEEHVLYTSSSIVTTRETHAVLHSCRTKQMPKACSPTNAVRPGRTNQDTKSCQSRTLRSTKFSLAADITCRPVHALYLHDTDTIQISDSTPLPTCSLRACSQSLNVPNPPSGHKVHSKSVKRWSYCCQRLHKKNNMYYSSPYFGVFPDTLQRPTLAARRCSHK